MYPWCCWMPLEGGSLCRALVDLLLRAEIAHESHRTITRMACDDHVAHGSLAEALHAYRYPRILCFVPASCVLCRIRCWLRTVAACAPSVVAAPPVVLRRLRPPVRRPRACELVLP